MLKKMFQLGVLVITLVFVITVAGCVINPIDNTEEEGNGTSANTTHAHIHTYSTTWSKNAEQHWRRCTGAGCDTRVRIADHTLVDGICTTCEYDTVHVHTYSTTWSKNAEQHWKECTVAGCDAKREIADHAPPDDICAICEYDTTHTHTFSTSWSKNETQHWRECTVTGCDVRAGTADHAPPNGVCTSCGYDNREDNNEGVAPAQRNFRSVTKFEIIQYNANTENNQKSGGSTVTTASVPDAKTINPDQIKYSFSYENYDFYYIYLGVLANVPMFSFSTILHDGVLLSDYTVSITEEVRNSVSNSVETSVATAKSVVNENSVDQTTGGSVSQEVSMRWGNESAFFQARIALAAEQNWETTRGSSRSEGLE